MSGDIEKIKSRLDIVDIVSSYVPNLKKTGTSWKGLCPFHNEKTPSFFVNQSEQYFKCFGCGMGGDVISFIQAIENLDFHEALKLCAEKAGVTLSLENSKAKQKAKELEMRIIKANELAANYYNYILLHHQSGTTGKNYANKRGITSSIIKKFKVGFAPNSQASLKKFLLARGFNEDELVKFGLLVQRNNKTIDKFRNRLIQPIFSISGDIIGFSGRYIGDNKSAPKYLNSPETPVYKKNETLYSLFHAKEACRKKNEIILVEGNIDVLSSHKIGVENIVAPLGTSFTQKQAELIKRYVSRVLFCFDNDDAGFNALIRSIEIAEKVGLQHRVITLNGFQDADDLINNSSNGKEKWDEVITNSIDSIQYLIEKFKSEFDLRTVSGKKDFKSRILPIFGFLNDEVAKFHYAREISLILEVPESVIFDELNNTKTIKKKKEPISNKSKLLESEDVKKITLDQTSVYFLALLLNRSQKPETNYPINFLPDQNLSNFLSYIMNNFDHLDLDLLEKNNADFNEIVSAIFEIEIPVKIDLEKEFKKVEGRLWQSYLKREILHIRSLENIDDDENLRKLNELTRLLKEYN